MSSIFTDTITILRARKIPGDYGGTTDDWDNPEEIPVDFPVSVQPVSSDEAQSHNSHQVTDRWRIYTQPPNLLEELRPTDRIRVDTWGEITLAAGRPLHWRTNFLAHSEIDVEVIRGAHRP